MGTKGSQFSSALHSLSAFHLNVFIQTEPFSVRQGSRLPCWTKSSYPLTEFNVWCNSSNCQPSSCVWTAALFRQMTRTTPDSYWSFFTSLMLIGRQGCSKIWMSAHNCWLLNVRTARFSQLTFVPSSQISLVFRWTSGVEIQTIIPLPVQY